METLWKFTILYKITNKLNYCHIINNEEICLYGKPNPNYMLIIAYEPIGKTLSFRVSTDYKIKNLLNE